MSSTVPDPIHPATPLDLRNAQAVQIDGVGNVQNNYWSGRRAPSWPLQVGTPPREAVAFQGRPELMDGLAGAVPPGAPTAPSVIACGDGGVGKSQLAAAAFRRAQSAGVELAVWVPAATAASIGAGLRDARLVVDPDAIDNAPDSETLARGFLSWLATTRRSWLVVLDDVAHPRDLDELWPSGPSGRTIVTTRRRDLALPGAVSLPVDVFAPAHSVAYLSKRLNLVHQGTLLDAAEELAEFLGHRPVALAQAAAYMINEDIACSAYIERLNDRTRRLEDVLPDSAPADGYAHTTAAAALLALDAANRLPPERLAGAALQLAAVLDRNGAPTAVWETPEAMAFLSAESGGPVNGENARSALRNLHRLSLITHAVNSEVGADVRTHGLTQRAVLDSVGADRAAELVRMAADALLAVWPDPEGTPRFSATLRRNVATLQLTAPDGLWTHEPHPVLLRMGHSYWSVGLLSDAITHFTELQDAALVRYEPEDPALLDIRSALIAVRGEAGEPARAVQEHELLLRDVLRILGADHEYTLSTRNNLAYWRSEAGDAQGAGREYEQLEADQVRVLGADHRDTLTTRSNRAGLLGSSGDPVGAGRQYEALLADRLRVLGADHPSTLTTRNNLAYWNGAAGDPATAVNQLEALLADYLRVLGPDHPDTLRTRSNLARWHGEAGDPGRAVAELTALHADRLRVLGPAHPATTVTANDLAAWRARLGSGTQPGTA